MKIAFMGGACSGKTTLIQQFLKQWPQYTLSEKTYRDVVKEQNLPLNKQGNESSQRKILDALVEEIDSAKGKNVVFDRCVVDNVVYSLWLLEQGRLSQGFIIDSKYKIREAVQKYDIIFYVPYSDSLPIEEREGRETDLVYIKEIDNIFAAMVNSYEKGKDSFFPLENCPAVITLNTVPDMRCNMIRLYLKDSGDVYTEKDGSLIYS